MSEPAPELEEKEDNDNIASADRASSPNKRRGKGKKGKRNKLLHSIRRSYSNWSRARTKLQLERMAAAQLYFDRQSEDQERARMLQEDQLSWVAFSLKERNRKRMSQAHERELEEAEIAQRKEKARLLEQQEDGITYHMAAIKSYKRWRPSDAKHRDFIGHTAAVTACDVAFDGKHILSSSEDTTVVLWNAKTAKVVMRFEGHTTRVNDCAFAPEFDVQSKAPQMLSCATDGSIRLWTPTSGTSLKHLQVHGESIYCCRIVPGGRRFLTSSEDKTIRTWTFPEGIQLFVYRGHSSGVTSICVSPSARYIASAGNYGDRLIRLWDGSMPRLTNPVHFGQKMLWGTSGLIMRILLNPQLQRDFWFKAEEILDGTCPHPVDIWRGERLDGGDSDDDDGQTASTVNDTARGDEESSDESSQATDADSDGSDDLANIEGASLAAISINQAGQEFETSLYIPGTNLVFAVDSMDSFDRLFITAVRSQSQYEIYSDSSGVRVGTFECDVRYDHTVRYTCEGKALEMKTEEAVRSFRCTWQAPSAATDSVSVHCSVRLLPDERWVTLAVTLREGQAEQKGVNHSTNLGMDSVLMSTAEDLLTYTFDACARHNKFMDALRDGDDELALSQLQSDVVLYFGKRKVTGAQAVLRTLKARFGVSDSCIWQYPFTFKPGQTRALMVAERPQAHAAQHLDPHAAKHREHDRQNERSGGGGSVTDVASRFSLTGLIHRTTQSSLIIEELARREADRIIKLRRQGLHCSEEIRTYGIPPSVTHKLPLVHDSEADTGALDRGMLTMEDLLGPETFGPGIDAIQMPYPDYFPKEIDQIQAGLSTERYVQAAKLLRTVFPLIRQALQHDRSKSNVEEETNLFSADKLRAKLRHQLAKVQKLRSAAYRERLRMRSVAKQYNEEVDRIEHKLKATHRALQLKRTRQLQQARKPSVWSKIALALKRRRDLKSQHRQLREMLVPHIRAYMDAKARGQNNLGITDSSQKYVRKQLTQIENNRQTLPVIESLVRNDTALHEAGQQADQASEQSTGLLRCFIMQADIPLSHQGTINDLAFNHAETALASCGAEGIIKVWNINRGTLLKTLGRGDGALWSNRFTDDDAHIVTAGADCTIRLWSTISNDLILELRGHADVVYRCVPHRNGALLVSCSHDRTVCTWYTVAQPPDAPSAPVIANITMNTVAVSWHAPPAYGETITAYHLEYRTGPRSLWQSTIHVAPFTTSRMIQDLTPATPYQVRVAAENRMGCGEWSEPCRQFVTLSAPPAQIARPIVVETFQYTVLVAWLCPQINVYGAATDLFIVDVSGGGHGFGDGCQHLLPFSVCHQHGHKLKERLAAVAPHGGKLGDLSWQRTQQLSAELKDSEQLLMAAEISQLHPGEMYRFNVTARSRIGDGPLSDPSFSVRTLSAAPDAPDAPVLLESGLRSITLAWYPPKGNGAAIIGYRLYSCHSGNYVNLTRAQTSYEVADLFPGTSYRFALAARNSAGWSEQSPESADTCTKSSIPFPPPPPSAEALSCNDVRLRIVVPFANGAKVTSLLVQCKLMLPMRAGVWGQDREFPIARLRKIQTFASQPQVQYQPPAPLITNLQRAAAAKAARRQRGADSSNNAEPELLPQRRRPAGGISFEHHEKSLAEKKPFPPPNEWLMDVHFTNLLPDTPYIFRCSARNEHGFGTFSEPSQRIKTRRPGPPAAPVAPLVDEILPTTLLLTWKTPASGGSIVTGYVIEYALVTTGVVTKHNVQDVLYHRLQGLMPGQLYKFRVIAENRIGLGPPGAWTHPIQTPEI